MRLLCAFRGHLFNTLREEWIPPRDEKDYTSLLRFDECSHCRDVRVTLTHPEDYKSRWSSATKYGHRSLPPEEKKDE